MPKYRVRAERTQYLTWETEASSSWEACHIAHDLEEMPDDCEQGTTEGWIVEEIGKTN